MKPKNTDLRHELLSELHRLLSIASASDFIAASALCKSENIKLALEALAEEHLAEERGKPSRGRNEPRDKRDFQVRRIDANERKTEPSIHEFRRLLSTSRFGATKADLLRFAKANGLSVVSDNKDSLDRLIARFSKQLAALSGMEQSQIVSELLANSDPQTAGWMQVIRKR